MGTHTLLWTYTPCSKMNEAGVDPKRDTYDKDFDRQATAIELETGRPLFIAGDLNVAPGPSDTTVPRQLLSVIPSNKQFERDNYYKLLENHKLTNAAEKYAHINGTNLKHTWRKGRPSARDANVRVFGPDTYMSMRIDHVLAPKTHCERYPDLIKYPSLTAFETTPGTFNSDHNGNRFTITTAPARRHTPRAPQAYCRPSREPPNFNTCRQCGENFKSSNKLHAHIKAYGHERDQEATFVRDLSPLPACCANAAEPNRGKENTGRENGCIYVICTDHGLPALVRGRPPSCKHSHAGQSCDTCCSHKPVSDAPRPCRNERCVRKGREWLLAHEKDCGEWDVWTPPADDSGTWNPGES